MDEENSYQNTALSTEPYNSNVFCPFSAVVTAARTKRTAQIHNFLEWGGHGRSDKLCRQQMKRKCQLVN
ncbi:hypothetical protein MTR67_038404 [Solanum verrucosum]|uniref:Uncharacterized protein n=1 Tax=Solanum verrucosum TaxID=315347 RepID=A0AAF0ZQ77_SOLVR|nr:hypothetical protein MTR67_038404 [Solanum verrucosum]